MVVSELSKAPDKMDQMSAKIMSMRRIRSAKIMSMRRSRNQTKHIDAPKMGFSTTKGCSPCGLHLPTTRAKQIAPPTTARELRVRGRDEAHELHRHEENSGEDHALVAERGDVLEHRLGAHEGLQGKNG